MAELAAMLPMMMSAAGSAASGASSVLSLVSPVAGMFLSAKQAKEQGKYEQRVAEFEATELEKEGARQRSEAQRVALDERERADRVMSRQRAVAANSGAGTYNNTILDLMGDVSAEGDYRANLALAKGENALRGYQDKAALRLSKGAADYKGSLIEGFGDAISKAPDALDSFASFTKARSGASGIGKWKTTVHYG